MSAADSILGPILFMLVVCAICVGAWAIHAAEQRNADRRERERQRRRREQASAAEWTRTGR